MMNRQRKLIILSGIGAGMLICLYVFKLLLFRETTFEERMRAPLKLINKRGPYMVDKSTRFDSAAPQPGETVVYYYTFLDTDSAELMVNELKKTVEPILLERAKTDPALDYLRKKNITIGYSYRDKNGAEIIRLDFKAERYK